LNFKLEQLGEDKRPSFAMHSTLLSISPRETRTFLSSPSGGGLQASLQRLANGVLQEAVAEGAAASADYDTQIALTLRARPASEGIRSVSALLLPRGATSSAVRVEVRTALGGGSATVAAARPAWCAAAEARVAALGGALGEALRGLDPMQQWVCDAVAAEALAREGGDGGWAATRAALALAASAAVARAGAHARGLPLAAHLATVLPGARTAAAGGRGSGGGDRGAAASPLRRGRSRGGGSPRASSPRGGASGGDGDSAASAAHARALALGFRLLAGGAQGGHFPFRGMSLLLVGGGACGGDAVMTAVRVKGVLAAALAAPGGAPLLAACGSLAAPAAVAPAAAAPAEPAAPSPFAAAGAVLRAAAGAVSAGGGGATLLWDVGAADIAVSPAAQAAAAAAAAEVARLAAEAEAAAAAAAAAAAPAGKGGKAAPPPAKAAPPPAKAAPPAKGGKGAPPEPPPPPPPDVRTLWACDPASLPLPPGAGPPPAAEAGAPPAYETVYDFTRHEHAQAEAAEEAAHEAHALGAPQGGAQQQRPPAATHYLHQQPTSRHSLPSHRFLEFLSLAAASLPQISGVWDGAARAVDGAGAAALVGRVAAGPLAVAAAAQAEQDAAVAAAAAAAAAAKAEAEAAAAKAAKGAKPPAKGAPPAEPPPPPPAEVPPPPPPPPVQPLPPARVLFSLAAAFAAAAAAPPAPASAAETSHPPADAPQFSLADPDSGSANVGEAARKFCVAAAAAAGAAAGGAPAGATPVVALSSAVSSLTELLTLLAACGGCEGAPRPLLQGEALLGADGDEGLEEEGGLITHVAVAMAGAVEGLLLPAPEKTAALAAAEALALILSGADAEAAAVWPLSPPRQG
jgi:hypothetical protein